MPPPRDDINKTGDKQQPGLLETDIVLTLSGGLGKLTQHHQFRQWRDAPGAPNVVRALDALHERRRDLE